MKITNDHVRRRLFLSLCLNLFPLYVFEFAVPYLSNVQYHSLLSALVTALSCIISGIFDTPLSPSRIPSSILFTSYAPALFGAHS